MARFIYAEIAHERHAQDAKWGEQNHPDGTGPNRFPFGYSSMKAKGLADAARLQTDRAAAAGTVTYTDIFLEEVFEALAEDDPAKLRAELIQCAAVAVAWVEKIDRDNAKKEA